MRNLNVPLAKRGFTLVELLIVIIIIAVLAAIAIPKFANSSIRSKEDSPEEADLKLYRNAIELFKNDCGSYPSALVDVTAVAAPANGKDSSGNTKAIVAADWKGPYVQDLENDPVLGAAFTYSVTPAPSAS